MHPLMPYPPSDVRITKKMEIDALKAYLAAQPSLRLAILFGSLASGCVRPDSDIDLAVASEGRLNAQDRAALIEGVSLVTGRPVDLIDLRVAGEPLLGQILQNGVRLAVRDEQLLAELIKRHLFDSVVFLPLQKAHPGRAEADMDRAIIEEKLEALRYCVEGSGAGAQTEVERLSLDADPQDIIAMNLARAVQLSVDVAAHILAKGQAPAPSTMAEAF